LLITASTGETSKEPSFAWSSSESVTVVQGENLTLECAAHGVPAPQLSWEKYGGHVPYGRHSLLLGKMMFDIQYFKFKSNLLETILLFRRFRFPCAQFQPRNVTHFSFFRHYYNLNIV